MENWVMDLCRRMPKAELHLHLDGALDAGLALELAAESGWAGFDRPQSYAQLYRRLVVEKNAASQEELLAFFELPGLLLHTPQSLCAVARRLMVEKAADNVRYLEIRWAPAFHRGQGLTNLQVVKLVQNTCDMVAMGTGQTFRLIVCGIRTLPLEENIRMLEEVSPLLGHKLIAADYAGLEAVSPNALEQEAFFTRARELGYAVTLHCGELPGSAPRILEAAEKLAPRRIAHGPRSIDDPKLCALLKERDIMLDLCPTSNIQAGLFPDHASYPLKDLVKAGVPVSVNSDSNTLNNLTLSDEYINLLRAGQVDLPTLWRLNLDALAHSFLPEKEKQRLLAEFKAWGELVPELSQPVG